MSNDVKECRSCKAKIVWMKTRAGKSCPVDADSYHGEELFNPGVNVSHFKTCPDANSFSGGGKKDAAPTDNRLDQVVKDELAVWLSTIAVEIPSADLMRLRVNLTNAIRKAIQ